MHLAEELLLLLIRRAAGTLPSRPGVHAALAAAVLAELIEDGEAEIADGWVSVRPGHPLTDGPIEDVLSGTGFYRPVLDRLTEQGALVRRRRWWTFGLVSTTVWRLADHARRDALVADVTGEVATPRLETLAAVLDALGVLTTNRPETELTRVVAKAARTRVDRPVNPTDIG